MYINNEFWAMSDAIEDVDIFLQDVSGFSCTKIMNIGACLTVTC